MLSLVLIALLGQFGICKPGVACQVNSVQTVCVPFASLGTCAANIKGTVRCASNRTPDMYECNGSAWVPLSNPDGGVFVMIAGDTMTGGLVTPQVDAGQVISRKWLFGTTGGGTATDAIQESGGQIRFTVDGGSNNLRIRGDANIEVFQQVMSNAITFPYIKWCAGDSTCATAPVVSQFENASPSSVLPAIVFEQLLPFVATGDAGIIGVMTSDAGLLFSVDDQKANAPDFCIPSTGQCLSANLSTAQGSFSGDVSATAYPVNTAWAAFVPTKTITARKLTFVTEIAGVGAGTILGTVFKVGSSNVCTVTITCNSAAGTVVTADCSAFSMPANATYDMRWTTDGCTTRPAGDLNLSYTTP